MCGRERVNYFLKFILNFLLNFKTTRVDCLSKFERSPQKRGINMELTK